MRLNVALLDALKRRPTVILTLVAASLSFFLFNASLDSPKPTTPAVVQAAPPPAQVPAPAPIEKLNARPFTLRSGQTLSQLLNGFGLSSEEVVAAVTALGRHLDVRRVRAGEGGTAFFEGGERFKELSFKVGQKGWVTLSRSAKTTGFETTWRDLVREVQLRRIDGELDSYLFADLKEAGAPAQLADTMSDVLQWDLDFDRDLQYGDRFSVIYEEVTLDGEKAGIGRILALSYQNRGRSHEAFLYGLNERNLGYYDAEGRPLQKMFLRSPLPFMRVTSRFSHSRMHPVLKVARPHYGVDLGAPIGTPVRATASGTVTFAAANGGAGRMVTIRHAQGYESSYLHLSRFGEGIRVGTRVGQGDLIGYVGNSGHSTGAHLDYRIKHNGHYLDPMSLKNQPVEPIPQYQLAAFLERRDACRASLSQGVELPALRFANDVTTGASSAPVTKTAR